MTAGTRGVRMPTIVTAICLVGGAFLALAGLSALLVLAIGTWHDGRYGVIAAAVLQLTAAASLLVLPFHRRLGKILGIIALVLLAAGMVVAVFHPDLAAATPGGYQVAGIALVVLLLARLGLAMRPHPKNTEH